MNDLYANLVTLFVCFLIVVSFGVGGCVGRSALIADAIQHKAGQYVLIDSNSGHTKFMWNDEISKK